MITAGIDVGLEYTKVVVMKDGKVLGRACVTSGGTGRSDAVRKAYDEALGLAGVTPSEVEKIGSTGKGKFNIPYTAAHFGEAVVAVKAAGIFEPGVTTVVDIGADEIVAATVSDGKISEFVINQKCAAGLGLLLESMAERFDISLEKVSALEGPCTVAVNDGCVVFAEQDALSLVNRGITTDEAMKALIEACACRANSTLNDIYKPDRGCVVLIGGMTRYVSFVSALERVSGISFVVPEEAYYASAIGAAALAVADV